MTAARRVGTVLGFLVLSLACNVDRPTAPSGTPATQQPPTAQPPPSNGGPSLSQLAGIYAAVGPLSYPIAGYTATSRYVLREGGAFSLEYPQIPVEYVGTYTYENESVTFHFGRSRGSGAVGTFNGDLLEVRYSDSMEQADFQNAAYRRSQ